MLMSFFRLRVKSGDSISLCPVPHFVNTVVFGVLDMWIPFFFRARTMGLWWDLPTHLWPFRWTDGWMHGSNEVYGQAWDFGRTA